MKHIIIFIIVLTSIVTTSNAGWFNDDNQQINKLEEQVQEQQHSTGDWQTIAFVLGTGCVVLLVVGAAIGSKARKDAK